MRLWFVGDKKIVSPTKASSDMWWQNGFAMFYQVKPEGNHPIKNLVWKRLNKSLIPLQCVSSIKIIIIQCSTFIMSSDLE